MAKNGWRLVAVSTAIIVTALIGSSAYASPASSERHCLITLTGNVKPSGELEHSPMRCFSTFDRVLAAVGPNAVDPRQSNDNLPRPTGPLTAQFIIGVHYDGAGFSGSSFSVSGSNCSGGWLNVASSWNDRISSTVNGCPRIAHFEHANLGGARFDTTGGGGDITGVMNNKTTSIQYLNG